MDDRELIAAILTAGMLPTLPMPRRGSGWIRLPAWSDTVRPSGSLIAEALLKDAEPTVNALVEPGKRAETMKLLQVNRHLLELYAVRSRNTTAYTKRKAELGLRARPKKKSPRQS
jgi:hypothetical protein